MANSKIPRPSSNKIIALTTFETTVDAYGMIELINTDYITALWLTAPVNAFAIKQNSNHVKVFQTTWNSSEHRFVLSELAEGTTVIGNVIYF